MLEKEFHNWVKKELIPYIFLINNEKIINIISLSDRKTSGIPDILVISTNGVFVFELKYRTFNKEPLYSNKAFTHQISELQRKFLNDWWESNNGKSFVIYGVDLYNIANKVHIIPGNVITKKSDEILYGDINEMSCSLYVNIIGEKLEGNNLGIYKNSFFSRGLHEKV